MSSDTGLGTSQVFCRKLEKDHRRSVGVVCNTTRLHTGVHKKPPQAGIRQTSVPSKNLELLNAEVAELLGKDAI